LVLQGYIALEFACIFKQLGAEVHVYYRQPLPLRGFDEEVLRAPLPWHVV
jgi:glutathione reductase (NADPH)